jgi:hypothetical protein
MVPPNMDEHGTLPSVTLTGAQLAAAPSSGRGTRRGRWRRAPVGASGGWAMYYGFGIHSTHP